MAGGQGTRFWPWSTEKKPKQFLNIIGKDPLITQTFNRLKKFIKPENIYIVADRMYLGLITESIPGFDESNFLEEPCPRNTAPCLILSNIVLCRKDDNANVLVVPADHYIPDADVFAGQMSDALEFADNRYIITSGIEPDSPHTGYGYIKFMEKGSSISGSTEFFEVEGFKEKPEFKVAKNYLEEGNYCWNSGMFVYKLKHFKDFLEKYADYYFRKYVELEQQFDNKAEFEKVFSNIKPDSIDYALMEKAEEVLMFKAKFKWSDVGAWSSVYELNEKDKKNNVSSSESNILIDTENSLVFTTGGKPVAVVGLKDVAIISTENGVLVSALDELQKVKDVLRLIK